MNYVKQNGLLVPEGLAKGVYHAELFRGGKLVDEWDCKNIIVNEGLISMLNIMFAGISVISNWYIGVFQNNYTPVNTDTAASIVGNAGEVVAYSGGARPNFTPAAAAGSPTITNAAAKAVFTFTGTATLMGAFLISSATPGSNTGTLYSAALFGSSKSVGNTDQLTLTYQTSLSS